MTAGLAAGIRCVTKVKGKRMVAQQQELTNIFRFRIPLDSVSGRMAVWGPAAHALLTLAGAGWSIWHEIAYGNHAVAYDLFKAIGYDVLWAFAVSTAVIVTIAEVIDAAMVMAHFVGQWMKKQGLAEGHAAGLAEGKQEGLTEGVAIGRAQAEAELNERLNQYLAAHPELKDTIEPLRPGVATAGKD